ncbi:MAG: hypothetical protein HY520_04345 [Candidatus Aenigmarchaeota archaeon]|nr:hypothetical protein [Candidatus Aenigmarchaeota archaeon]
MKVTPVALAIALILLAFLVVGYATLSPPPACTWPSCGPAGGPVEPGGGSPPGSPEAGETGEPGAGSGPPAARPQEGPSYAELTAAAGAVPDPEAYARARCAELAGTWPSSCAWITDGDELAWCERCQGLGIV